MANCFLAADDGDGQDLHRRMNALYYWRTWECSCSSSDSPRQLAWMAKAIAMVRAFGHSVPYVTGYPCGMHDTTCGASYVEAHNVQRKPRAPILARKML